MPIELKVNEWSEQILSGIPCPVAILDHELRILYVNAAFREIGAGTNKNILSLRLTDLFPDKVIREILSGAGLQNPPAAKLNTAGRTWEFDTSSIASTTHWTLSALSKNDPELYLMTGDLKSNHEEVASVLRDTQEQLRAVMTAEQNSIITITESGIIHSFSASAEEMFGYSAIEVIGKNISILMPDPFSKEHDSYLDNYLKSGIKKIIGIGREVIAKRKDETTFPIFLAVDELQLGGERYFTGIIKDLTAQQQLEKMQSAYQLLLEQLTEGADLVDILTLLANSCRSAIPGAAINIMVAGYRGKKLSCRAIAGLEPGFQEMMESIATSRDCCPCSECYATGELIIVPHISKSNFSDIWKKAVGESDFSCCWALPVRASNDQIIGAVCLYFAKSHLPSDHEMTILKDFARLASVAVERGRDQEMLRQSQKMESIGLLTGGLAHDFNNLLTVVQGNLELLESRLNDPSDIEAMNEALEATEQGAKLTHRMLTFARRQSISPETIDINLTVLDMTKLLSRTLGEGIELTTSLTSGVWPVRIDPGQFEDALVNLCINARDAMPEGGKLLIKTENHTLQPPIFGDFGDLAGGSYVCVSVTDSGRGIDQSDLNLIFDPFFTTKEVGKGSGLGLSMVYGFAKRAKGTISAYSELGIGTTFNLYLPRATGQDAGPRRDRVTDERSLPTGNEKILLVEDDPRVRNITKLRLVRLGYQLVEADTGAAGLAAYDLNPDIALVFTDLIMPGSMTGKQMADAILSRNSDTKILYTSGYADPSIVDDDPSLHESMLRKPYSLNELAHRIRQVIDA